MSDDAPEDLVFRHGAMEHEGEAGQDEGQVWRGEDEEAEKGEARLGVASAPDVDEGAGQGGAEEGHGEQGRDEQEDGGGVEEEPGEVGGGGVWPAGGGGGEGGHGFFEEARVALEEEDVEEEVERQGAEVDEGGEEAPVL